MASPIQYEIHERDDSLYLCLQGDLDEDSFLPVTQALAGRSLDMPVNVDLQGVTYADSAGLRALVLLQRQVRDAGVNFTLRNDEERFMASKYGKKAQTKVKRAMHERKEGTLRSGRSGKKVTSRKQAIAIGLSEARRAGGKVPSKSKSKSSGGRKKSSGGGRKKSSGGGRKKSSSR